MLKAFNKGNPLQMDRKIIQFTVPISTEETVIVHNDILPYFYNYFHRHSETQITLIIRGEGTLIAGNYTQPFKPGDIYILGADQPHIFKADPIFFEKQEEKAIHAIHIFFDCNGRLKWLMMLPEFEKLKKFLGTTYCGLQLPEKYAVRAAKDIKKINAAEGYKRLMLFIELLHAFAGIEDGWRSLSTGFPQHNYSDSEGVRMNAVYQYTIEHYADNITLFTIASVAHLSVHAFCKYFKKHTRKTYISFLNEIRINEACKKMISGDFDGISSIAYATGFNNPVNFNRVFKKVMDMSPTDYCKEFRFKQK